METYVTARTSETTQTAFRERLDAARRHRSQSVSRAVARLERVSGVHLSLHEELERHITFFNNPARLRGTSRLYAERRPAAKAYDPTSSSAKLPAFVQMGGVRFRTMEIGDKDNRRVLAKTPTKRDLALYFFAEEIPWQHGSLKTILTLSRHAEAIRVVAESVGKALSLLPVEALSLSPVYQPVPAAPFLSPSERVKHLQAELAQATISQIQAANDYLTALEGQLDEACMRFNSVISKYARRGKLLCYWEVNPPVRIDTCRTVKGPTFYTLSLGHRTLTRVRTGGADIRHPPRNSITQALIRQCFLGRYSDAYLEQAAAIERLRAQRLELVSVLQTIVRVLRGTARIREETNHE